MSWTCEQIEERLSDYVDRLLSPAEGASFAAHVESCPRCAPLVARVNALVAELHHLEPLESPAGLVERILEQTLGTRQEKKPLRDWRTWLEWRTWRDWMQVAAQPRYAMAAVTLAITFSVVSQALGIQWRQVGWKDLNPVNIVHSVDRRANLIYARGIKFVNDLRVVYEIQTRLRPETEPTPAPPPEQPKDKNSSRPRSEKELNRADELKPIPSLLASTVAVLPGRSLR
jgi:hypothetical protein